jgi:hypothetical protein
MQSSSSAAPWQIGSVSASGRIATAALVALSIDSTFMWRAIPYSAVAIAMTIVPLIVGIRVIRGFPRSLTAAGLTFGGGLALAAVQLRGVHFPSQMGAALTVALALSGTGLLAVAIERFRGRRAMHPVIAIPLRDRDGFAVAPSRRK